MARSAQTSHNQDQDTGQKTSGRPRKKEPLAARIDALRRAGKSWMQIAQMLDRSGFRLNPSASRERLRQLWRSYYSPRE